MHKAVEALQNFISRSPSGAVFAQSADVKY